MNNTAKMDFLVAFYIFCIVTSELMGGKTFPLLDTSWMKLNASVAIFVLPIIFTINDVIAEVYGRERTKSLIRSGLLVIVFILVFSLFATHLPASKRFAAMEPAYEQVFGVSTRIAAASLTAFTLAEFLDVAIFMKLRQKLGKRGLWLRNNVSNFISQFFDTTVFMVLAFYNLARPLGDNGSFLLSLIIPYWLLKCFMSVIETPFVYLGVRWLKKENKS